MNRKMKVALEDIKYIQTQIQKILHITKDSPHLNSKSSPQNRSPRLMRDTFSSSFKNTNKSSPFDTIKSKSKSSNYVSLTKSNTNSPGASHKSKTKDKISVKRKKSPKAKNSESDNKMMSPDQAITNQQKNNEMEKGKNRNQIIKMKKVQSNQMERFERQTEKKQQVPPLVKIEKDQFKETRQKWAKLQKGSTPKSRTIEVQNEIYKRVNFYQQKQILKTPVEPKIITEPSKQVSKDKEINDKNSIKCQSPRAMTLSNDSPKSIVYSVERKQQVPYYKNKKNTFPIRTDEEYLQKKYKQKKLQKEKKEALKQKYQMLDQRLNKIRGQLNISPIEKVTDQEKKKLKQSKKYKQVLKQYLRYSPLSKFVKTNEKLKIQTQKMRSLQQNIKSPDSKAMKLMNGYGRPIFGL